MAFVIVSAGALADSGLRTVNTRTLMAAAGVLALAGLLGAVAIGFALGRATLGQDDVGGPAGFPQLDLTQPGNQALVHQVGSLSSRLIRLEAEASRLARRIGAATGETGGSEPSVKEVASKPAGGPLLRSQPGDGPALGESLLRLNQDLEGLEQALGTVAATAARQALDQMAFPSRAPIPGVPISSGFGRRLDPFTGRPARHTGVDYSAPHGTPILASAGGRVRYAGPRGPYGKTVEIDHGEGLVTRYGHASKILVRRGDVLLPGQEIAIVGSTGRSTGPHVHFEILREGTPVHPGPYLSDEDS